MPTRAPHIDPRSYREIVEQTAGLAQNFSPWRPRPDGQPDAGEALIRIFARMVTVLIDRLNQVPDKNFLAFLDLIGARVQPPQPARVPLTFSLAAGATDDAFVPARTQVATAPADGQQEIVFETERDLLVTRSQLVGAFTRNPEQDTYGDCSAYATRGQNQAFRIFGGDPQVDRLIEHSLYLAHDEILTLPGPKTVIIEIELSDDRQLQMLNIAWSYWNGAAWAPLQPQVETTEAMAVSQSPDGTTTATVLGARWQITLANPPIPTPLAIGDRSGRWLRAQAQAPLRPLDLRPEMARSGQAVLEMLSAFAPFGESAAQDRMFYLSIEQDQQQVGALVTLRLGLEQSGAASEDLALIWSFYDGKSWRELGRSIPADSPAGDNRYRFEDGTRAFTRSGMVRFQLPPEWQRANLFGHDGLWMRVQRAQGNYGTGEGLRPPRVRLQSFVLPRIRNISMVPQTGEEARLLPNQGFANSTPLDLSKDFLPFGERPRLGDALYLLSQEVFARPGAQVTIKVQVSAASNAAKDTNRQLAWEAWDGSSWAQLSVTDGTELLTTSGTIIFTLPASIAAGTVNGVTGHWVRARLAAGNYGTEPHYEMLRDEKGYPRKDGDTVLYRFVQGGFAPPIIQSLRLNCTYLQEQPPTGCLTCNDFRYVDRTAALTAHSEFIPFAPTTDTQPALYLGFDRPFANRPTLLYAQVEPEPFDETSVRDSRAAAPQIVWEYAAHPPNGTQGALVWKHLGAQDATRAFAERGLVAFVGPRDMVHHAEFGRRLSWLRARWESGVYQTPPRLRRVLTNTVWASQTTTVQSEELGSSDGSPNQSFQTNQAPVLPGQQIEVREPELPVPEEQAAIHAQEGVDAIAAIVSVADQVQGVWVRWHEVPDFYVSGPRDRHYTFDHLAGAVRFGDGQRGMIPPQGRNSIRAARYRTGGGEQGNRPAGSITQLKSALAYIDSVTNLEPAGGGADQESLERVKEHGPHMLRHRGRSVAAQDYEDLALEASANVARALAITPRFNPLDLGQTEWVDPKTNPTDGPAHDAAGQVNIILVPRSDDPQPTPSLELIDQVEAYMLLRCPPTVELRVTGPSWIKVTVTAEVAPVSLEAADALAPAVAAALRRFLHPLSGGTDGRGWAFGRRPHLSDLIALIEAISGVDHVSSIDITATFDDPSGDKTFDDLTDDQRARLLIYSGDHQISLVALSEGD